jgi:hypothetical protein
MCLAVLPLPVGAKQGDLTGSERMKHHELYAVLAVITFIGHLIAIIFTDVMWWLPEIVWVVSIIFSVLAIYSGIVTATRTDLNQGGTAIASAVVGGIVLLVLLYSGVSWLFMPEEGYEVMTSLI